MPTATIELPRDMVEAAESYAERSHRSMVDLFANALKVAYGIDSMYVMRVDVKSRPTPVEWPKIRVRDRKLSPRVEALCGSLKLPPELEGKSYDELKDEYFREKYGVFE